tara:strand:+ start:124 stop:360 length:237 start_codon:yes stop_codon:yes gene_type:complete
MTDKELSLNRINETLRQGKGISSNRQIWEKCTYSVTEYCNLFYVICVDTAGHGCIDFESEHEQECVNYIYERITENEY